MSREFVLWTSKIEPNACTLSDMGGFSKIFALRDGVVQGGDFPPDVTMQMDPRKPTDTLLTDNLRNLKNIIVVSSELRDFLEERKISELEFLPVVVLDHKGRPVNRTYSIMNPTNNPDCLDMDLCQPVWGAIDDRIMKKVKALVVKADWDGSSRPLFRPKHYRARPLVLKSLADEITAAGFTGIRWEPISEISGRLK